MKFLVKDHINLHMVNNNDSMNVFNYLKFLHLKSYVKSIDLSFNRLELKESKLIYKLLINNRSLKRINICWNYLGSTECMIFISNGLKRNKTLQEIDFQNNNFQDEGLRMLLKAFKINNSVQRLVLSNNTDSITEDIINYMCECFKVNESIQILDLFNNNISNGGAKYLSSLLKKNKIITSLKLNGNNFDNEGARYFLEALKINSSILDLELDTSISIKIRKEIKKELHINCNHELFPIEIEKKNKNYNLYNQIIWKDKFEVHTNFSKLFKKKIFFLMIFLYLINDQLKINIFFNILRIISIFDCL